MRRARTERGAALLLAMLTVMLVATFAATALWQQWRAVEVETHERARGQSAWLLVGALDWARLILREDYRSKAITGSPQTDHLAEPWAVPLQESRLSTFLAAERGVFEGDADDLPEVFLSGRIIDLQSRLNITNLVSEAGEIGEKPMRAFTELFAMLGLPPQELELLAQNLRLARLKQLGDGSDAPLWPQRFEQLAWLGLSPPTVRALAEHVTVLPVSTKVNLNTASAEVIAATAGLDLAQAQQLVVARTRNAFQSTTAADKVLGLTTPLSASEFEVTTSYFEVHGRLRTETTLMHERSLVRRNQAAVTTLWRERVNWDSLP